MATRLLLSLTAFFVLVTVVPGAFAEAPGNHIGVNIGAERVECSSCHREDKKPDRYDALRPWLTSRHAREGVTCIDCHLRGGIEGADFMKAVTAENKDDAHAFMVESPGEVEGREQFVDVCGGCHTERLAEFNSSVHATARLKGGEGVSCIDCHDAHRAAAISSTSSKLYRGNDLKTCGRCHKETSASYMSTFHGKQYVLGNSLVPTCTYCHIGHEPSADNAASVINAKNVGSICAGCHGEAMANGPGADAMMIHNLSKDSTRKVIHFKDPIKMGPFSIASFINSSYMAMIVGIVGFFTILSTRDFIKKTKSTKVGVPLKSSGRRKRAVKRFSVAWRFQHFLWAFSFIVLAGTGLSLKFPDAVFSQFIVWSVGGEAMRSSVHRVAALLFMCVGIVHVSAYLLRLASPGKLILTKKDFIDAFLYVSYLFDRAERMPLMGRYTWYQKLEYLATVVGGLIVISTGLIMWGFAPLVKNMPLALVYYAQLIHGWEAILAVLVIFVQHFYHTILNPLVFPMDLAWLTGKTNYEVMEHEHPLELMEIEAGKGDETQDEPAQD